MVALVVPWWASHSYCRTVSCILYVAALTTWCYVLVGWWMYTWLVWDHYFYAMVLLLASGQWTMRSGILVVSILTLCLIQCVYKLSTLTVSVVIDAMQSFMFVMCSWVWVIWLRKWAGIEDCKQWRRKEQLSETEEQIGKSHRWGQEGIFCVHIWQDHGISKNRT